MIQKNPIDFKLTIQNSGKTIYDDISVGDPDFWIPSPDLESLLNLELRGQLLKDGLGRPYPNRTRSKVVKKLVCKALGYPVPESFKRTQPRFYGQQMDVYVQKAMNLQIWNEELSPLRRYAVIQVSEQDEILRAKVINGQELALLDSTGTITTKYQARLEIPKLSHELVSTSDTEQIQMHVRRGICLGTAIHPTNEPESGSLIPICEIFKLLSPLVGRSFVDPGMDQERNRGAALHNLVCTSLGYSHFGDTGQFPDIRHQLLEVKLQTSPTVDLGLVLPNSEDPLDIRKLGDHQIRHCDTRYAVFYARTDGHAVTLTNLLVTSGQQFFTRFTRFEGKVKNGKIQLPLPRNFFSS